MSDLTAAKSWTLSAIIAPQLPLRFLAEDGEVLDLNMLSPVEQLVGAAASCFAQSCAGLMQFYGLAASPVKVTAWAHKPDGPLIGKGLDKLTLTVALDQSVEPSRRCKLLDDTKKICTVTNSLSTAIAIEVLLGESAISA